jgi:dipeptidase D
MSDPTVTTTSPAVLAGLSPPAVWRHFEALTQIPRPSGHEARVREHVVAFARARGLKVIVDDTGNVIIKKPASPGMEDRRGVILQGHLDMVPQKTSDSTHDFTTDPIRPRLVDGGLVKATNTTLGADNGIGVAIALAVLESTDLPHPPLEVLFTIDEEAGMTGARGLQPGLLDGEILLNLDSEDEGELCIGCAGGADFKASRTFSTSSPPAGSVALRVDVAGLRGGHSGVDIHLGRANANVLLARSTPPPASPRCVSPASPAARCETPSPGAPAPSSSSTAPSSTAPPSTPSAPPCSSSAPSSRASTRTPTPASPSPSSMTRCLRRPLASTTAPA